MTPGQAELAPDAWGITDVRRFGKYFLLRKLAEGGMAEIYLAKMSGAEEFERDVVIKLMLDHLRQSPDITRMFFDEARVAARLVHPNIVQIIDLGETDGRYFMCMEYLPGEDLLAMIARAREKNAPIPVDVVARIVAAACDGLDYAHEFQDGDEPLSIVHRDVSPSNILVTYQGVVKLLDFGIARVASQVARTDAGRVKGKWLYMSPEQARNEPLDRRSDVFSLGLTMHELLTQQRVFKRDNELAIVRAVLEDSIPSPKRFRPDVPDALAGIVMKALDRDVARRYPSARAMKDDLDAFLGGSAAATSLGPYMVSLFGREAMERRTQVPSLKALRARGLIVDAPVLTPAAFPAIGAPGVSARTVSGLTPAVAVAQPLAAPRPVAPAPREGGRQTLVIGAIAACALVAAASALFLALQRRSPPAPPVTTAPVAAPAASVVPPPTPRTPAADPAPKPEPRPSAPRPARSAPVQLTERDIAGVVSRSSDSILGCFEKFRSTLSATEGEVTLTMTILQSGAVSDARVATPGFESNPLSACIVRQVKALRFPRNVDREVTISLPFRYRVKS